MRLFLFFKVLSVSHPERFFLQNFLSLTNSEAFKGIPLQINPSFFHVFLLNGTWVTRRHLYNFRQIDCLALVGVCSLNEHDLICTTPRHCQNNKTPVALRGRGTTSAYNCFPATGLYFKSKVFASVGRGSTETTRLEHGSSMFGDTHAKGGGGGDLATSMATWLSSSLRNENGKLKIFVVRTTLLAKSHRC